MSTSRTERQEQAVRKWIKNKCNGTVVGCTGFGKTRIGLMALKKVIDKYPHIRFLVVVPTETLKNQWEEQLMSWDLGLNGEVQIINTVIRHEWQTDILCLDECHRYNADLSRTLFNKVKYKYILGLTATYERLDNKHKEVMDQYCPVIDEVTLAEALLNNWIAKYKEYQVLIDVDDIDVYNKYNKEFVEHFSYFNFDFDLVMSLLGPQGFVKRAELRDRMCPDGTEQQRKSVFKEITYHAQRFMQVLQARKKFINNHPKKIELARKIIEARPDSKIITFSNNVKMAESIGCGGLVYTGKDSKKKSRANIEEFNLQKKGILHTVQKCNEGADISGLSVAIVLGLDSSSIKAVQRRGRTVRLEENKSAEIFNIVINNTVETDWYLRSHKNSDYITIDEEGLQDVLNGKEPKEYKKKIKDFQFRF